ncbi:MAG: hypothetical protein ABJA66_20695 [Actinomycetota bacterium]
MSKALPIACYLTDKELQVRRKNYFDKAAESLIDSAELQNGFVFRFPLKETMLQNLAGIIDLERKCCPFLNFRLDVEAGKDFVLLELTGAEGTKEIIKPLFNWN